MADTLRDAYHLYIKRKYSDVIRILEPQVFRFREDFNFFHILGMSCLHQGDYGGAFSYLRRAIDLRETDTDTLLGIAAVYLKRGDSGSAIRMWLDVIEIDPDNVFAQRGLNYMKKADNPDEFSDISLENKISRFIPQPPKKKKTPRFLFFLFPAAAAVILIFLFSPLKSSFRDFAVETGINLFSKENKRPEIPDIQLDVKKDFIDIESHNIYSLTEKEIEKKIKDIHDYLYAYRDNMAQREVNIVLNSNASEYVKDRARLLGKYVAQPELTTFKDNFSWDDVSADPLIYKGCYVLWKGRAANVVNGTDSINFDFLVGYHEGKSLDGEVPVSFDFTVRIIPDQPIELLAMIEFDDYNNMRLRGVSVRRL